MKANLPLDQNAHPVQTLTPIVGETDHGTPTEATPARITLGNDVKIIRVATSGACWVAFGDSTVTATASGADSMFFPAGAEIFYVPEAVTDVSFLSVAGAGTVLVTTTTMR